MGGVIVAAVLIVMLVVLLALLMMRSNKRKYALNKQENDLIFSNALYDGEGAEYNNNYVWCQFNNIYINWISGKQ